MAFCLFAVCSKGRLLRDLQLFGFSFAAYSRLQRGVNLLCGVSLHSRHNMGIKVQRDANARMAKSLAGNLRMDTGRKHLRGMGMPKIMEADAGQGGFPENANPFVGKRPWLQGCAVDLGNDEAVTIGAKAKTKLFLCLAHSMSAVLPAASLAPLRNRACPKAMRMFMQKASDVAGLWLRLELRTSLRGAPSKSSVNQGRST